MFKANDAIRLNKKTAEHFIGVFADLNNILKSGVFLSSLIQIILFYVCSFNHSKYH